jgi:hypothetical protein
MARGLRSRLVSGTACARSRRRPVWSLRLSAARGCDRDGDGRHVAVADARVRSSGSLVRATLSARPGGCHRTPRRGPGRRRPRCGSGQRLRRVIPPTHTAGIACFLFAQLNQLAEDKRFELLRVSPTRFPSLLLAVRQQSGPSVTRHDGTERTVPDAAERPRMRRKLRRTAVAGPGSSRGF